MLNPFLPFTFGLIESFRGFGKRWLVAQTYNRSDDAKAAGKQAILLSHYSDLGFANNHLQAVRSGQDKYACVIDLEKPEHRQKVEEMIDPLSKYLVYTALTKNEAELQERLHKRYKHNIRRYIANNTDWRLRGDSTFNIKMEVIFGIAYVLMKYNRFEAIKVTLEIIEKS